MDSKKLKSTLVLHIGQPVKIVVAEPDRVIVAEHSVAKLVRELPEEEKIIQRSIGWLAQEGKITLDTVDRVETIALKG